MTKQEIEKAIENGESVWGVVWNTLYEIKTRYIQKISKGEIEYFDKDRAFYLEVNLLDIFKTKAEAEHYLHHANVTRTEQLPFLTWEEFKDGGEVIFKGHNGRGYALVYNKGLNKIDLFDTDGVFWGIVESWQPTEENFYKAYDECVKLFRGE